MSYRNEFPGFVLGVQIPANWEDVSWHNDTMPSWLVRFPDGIIKVWIDYDNPDDREQEGGFRFTICECDEEGETGGGPGFFESNDWAEVVAKVETLCPPPAVNTNHKDALDLFNKITSASYFGRLFRRTLELDPEAMTAARALVRCLEIDENPGLFGPNGPVLP